MHPIHNRERIISMDMMRGISILGIFMINMLSFHSPMLYIDPLATWNHPLDQWIYQAIDVLVQASFYPLFSLLFGYGFMILRERTLERKDRFTPIALRRLLFLLLIGWLHAHYIWHGDILFTYALFGLIYLPLMGLSGKAQSITAILLFAIPNGFLTIMMIITSLFLGENEIPLTNDAAALASYQAYEKGSYAEVTEQRGEDWYYVNNPTNTVFIFFSIFPMFMLGGACAKLDLLRRMAEWRKKLLGLASGLFAIAILLKILPYIMEEKLTTSYVQDTFGGPLLAVSYALLVAGLAETIKGRSVLSIFVPVGKLSLTNYLCQSILATSIFYSYGLGLYGKVSVWQGTLLALVIFSLQVILSRWWVKRYLYGPFEWVWRCVTYQKMQPFRKVAQLDKMRQV